MWGQVPSAMNIRGYLAGFAAGMTLVASATVLYVRSKPVGTPEDQAQAAKLNLAVNDFVRLKQLTDAHAGTEMSAADWTLVSTLAKEGLGRARVNAIVALRSLPKKSSHRDEAIRLAGQFLAEGHESGNVPAVQVLRYLGDPSWRVAASKLARSAPVEDRSMWKEMLNP